MKAVDQTTFDGVDNCLQACVASIFERPLEEVPNFCTSIMWFEELAEWLGKEYGLEPVMVANIRDRGNQFLGRSYYIATGQSSRNTIHSCVGFHSQIVHDPHPSKTGLLNTQDVIVFAVKDPSKMRKTS